MAADEHDQDRRAFDAVGVSARAPVAALLFDPASRPGPSEIRALAQASHEFVVTHHDDDAGLVELLREGLTFDCHGLELPTGLHAARAMQQPVLQQISLPEGLALTDLAWVTVEPGTHLTGLGALLPVVRIVAGLVIALGALPGLRAIAWLPARLAMSPTWFELAVNAWLRGGPFPALALTGLARTERGLESRGLSYFIGQEFVFLAQNGVLQENDARGAVRLTDWLVAHGRIDRACEIELAGFGRVLLEPEGENCLRASKF